MSRLKKLACIDLEGVLVPELWPAIGRRIEGKVRAGGVATKPAEGMGEG